MSKRTLFLIFALFIITFALLMLAIYQPQASKVAQTTPTPKEPVAQTTLSFGSPAIATTSSALTLDYSLPINITTGKNKVTAVQLELQYDPLILTDVEVVPGPFFANPDILLDQIDVETGRISYAFGVGLTDKGIAGKGIVANLTFSTRAASTPKKTAIIFLPKTIVTAEGINESVLKPTINGLFTVGTVEKKSSTSSAAPNQ